MTLSTSVPLAVTIRIGRFEVSVPLRIRRQISSPGIPGSIKSSTMRSGTRRLTRLTDRAAMRTFDITPDGKQIIFDRLRENSAVVLIDTEVKQ